MHRYIRIFARHEKEASPHHSTVVVLKHDRPLVGLRHMQSSACSVSRTAWDRQEVAGTVPQ